MSLSRCNIAIVSASRTPMGAFQGAFSPLSSPQLGAQAIAGCLAGSQLQAAELSEVIMGCVLPAGCGQAPARQAAIKAEIPDFVPATTVNKVCGSGMKAVMLGASQLQTGEANCVVAGGMESMTNAPYFLQKARGGYRLGHHNIKDHMFTDGLEDAYSGDLMGLFAQQTADQFGITREVMDNFALESLNRAQQAISRGLFKEEIRPVQLDNNVIDKDEQPEKARPEKIPLLKPAFDKKGTITAANSSSISDGAAALLMMREEDAVAKGFNPVARIKGYLSVARPPSEFTLAPVTAINRLLATLGWDVNDVDLYEINEAFAVVTLLALNELGLDHKRVNIYGGACALGHPLGASGARILVTLLNALKQTGGTKGIASLCIGGGEATAIAVEMIS